MDIAKMKVFAGVKKVPSENPASCTCISSPSQMPDAQ